MILTRKIEVYVYQANSETRQEHIRKLYEWRHLVLNGANEVLSYLYSIDRLKYYKFLTEKTKLEIGIIGVRGEAVKENSAPYVLLSQRMGCKVPSDILSCLQKSVTKKYQDIRQSLFKGNASLFTYKNNIPVPFSADSIRKLHSEENGTYIFTLFGICLALNLGRDRSNNRKCVQDCIDGICKIRDSSLMFDDRNDKIFLLLNYEPQIYSMHLDRESCINASLSIEIPIIASYHGVNKMIGTKEEFLYRRLQIQAAIRRTQINARYSTGGRGRKKKLAALDRYHNKEKDYIETKIHTYTKMLINYAIENNCGTINLINQLEKEKEAKRSKFILRNWSYYGFKKKLEYKAALYDIKINTITIYQT
ncbi:MAG: hypothetical protein VB022_02595 [Rikenellaceae bacterium]|nr:hypothetical protein [Rikenellaceae bacterium]